VPEAAPHNLVDAVRIWEIKAAYARFAKPLGKKFRLSLHCTAHNNFRQHRMAMRDVACRLIKRGALLVSASEQQIRTQTVFVSTSMPQGQRKRRNRAGDCRRQRATNDWRLRTVGSFL
jgi:hypothetical protein